ncbi:MAG: DeoR/GlpR family DNA-binding transcription regulator [Gorillibacterium sp.]|nr:DeoR/GlpR family DNA-binding transcription regulator [Gorillibacterium sp.]
MFAEERLIRIVEMVNQSGKVTVAELSSALGVSPVTIRRDLERLEDEKLLCRTHGGALSLEKGILDSAREKSFSEKDEAYAGEKDRIAEAAARLVEDEDAILLTPGTTNMRLISKLIGKKDLTIVTNASNIAMRAAGEPGWNVILTGGKIRPKSFALVGPLAENSLSGIRVDKLFLGVDGIDFKEGLTTPNLEEASVNRKMISMARQVIVVADRSKFGRVMFAHIADLTEVDIVVSDNLLSEEATNFIRKETDIRLLLA